MSINPKTDEVAERIREIEARAEKMPSIGSGTPMAASRIGIDFTISVLGGALLGWLVDMAVPSIAPWPLVGMIIAGFLSGLLNMWRSLTGQRFDKPVDNRIIMASLLDEFEIHSLSKPLFSLAGHTISFTNSSLFMFLAIGAVTMLMVLPMRPQAIVPGRWQMLAEYFYNLTAKMLTETAGEKARPFFPFIFSLFAFVLFCNLFGMLPGSLAVTSHIIINFALAILLFIVIIITGFMRHGWHFLTLFTPKGVPKVMIVPMTLIEFISFAVRPFSLSVRLFANMLAGHILLQVFAGMVVGLLAAGWLAGISILPMAANIAMTGFEFFVAFLQAYIYAILASAYLRDAIEMH